MCIDSIKQLFKKTQEKHFTGIFLNEKMSNKIKNTFWELKLYIPNCSIILTDSASLLHATNDKKKVIANSVHSV